MAQSQTVASRTRVAYPPWARRGRVIELDQTHYEGAGLKKPRWAAFGGRREVRDDAMPIPEYFAASALIVLITLAVAALVKGF
jgi:hypothetical protein